MNNVYLCVCVYPAFCVLFTQRITEQAYTHLKGACLGSQTPGPWTSCIHIAFWPGSNLSHSHKVHAVLNSQQQLNMLQTAQELMCRHCSLGSAYSQDPSWQDSTDMHATSAAFPYMHIRVHYLSKQACLQKFRLRKERVFITSDLSFTAGSCGIAYTDKDFAMTSAWSLDKHGCEHMCSFCFSVCIRAVFSPTKFVWPLRYSLP